MELNNFYSHSHIALWACPRSRSTLIARSFEQHPDCVMFDEPFYAPYLLTHGQHDPTREAIIATRDTDANRVISSLKVALPHSNSFGFQKHIAKNILPSFGTDWLPSHHIFLLRHPKEIIRSLSNIFRENLSATEIDMEGLWRIFQQVRADPTKKYLVLHADDILQDPAASLAYICDWAGIPFRQEMLSWSAGLQNSKLFFAGELLPHAGVWYDSIKNSTGFRPYRPSHQPSTPLANSLQEIVNACMPIYEQLLQQQQVLQNSIIG